MGNKIFAPLLGVLLLVAALGGLALAQSGGNYDVEWSVIGTAGDEFVSGGGYQLGFTLGQDQEPLVSAGGGYQVVQEYWSGGIVPTAVRLVAFYAEPQGLTLAVRWETAEEVDLLGFHLYRSLSPHEVGTRLNESLIPAAGPGGVRGASYTFLDETVQAGVTYYYTLEDVDTYGLATAHGPVVVALWRVYLPLVIE